MKPNQPPLFPLLVLDGIKFRPQPPDVDGDGVIGEEEQITLHQGLDQGIEHIQQTTTELGDSMDRLDSYNVDPETKMSEIDFNANLAPLEKNAFGVLDFLVSVHFLPEEVQYLSRRFKRLSVSVGGLGRSQKVAMVTGQRAHEEGASLSLMERLMGRKKMEE